jgi:hypothetical protein
VEGGSAFVSRPNKLLDKVRRTGAREVSKMTLKEALALRLPNGTRLGHASPDELEAEAARLATVAVPSHQRHARVTRQAEVNDGCPAYHHRGVSGFCVLNPDKGPYKPDPYWTPCDYSCSTQAPECCGW